MAAAIISFLNNSNEPESAEPRAAELRREAEEILGDGVSSDNEHRAIQTLLEIQLLDEPSPRSSGAFSDQPTVFLTALRVFGLTSLLILLVLSFPPRTMIGVGKGKERIPKTRLWLKILFVLIPTFLIMGVTASTLGSVIHAYFSSH